MMYTRRGAAAGFSLIETLISMTILGVTVLSVMTLFAISRANIYSGKEMTQSVALATHAGEDLSSLTVQGIYDAFAINSANSPALGTYVVDGVTYTDAMIRSTDATAVTNPPADIGNEATPAGGSGLLTNWRTQLSNNRGLQSGSIVLVIMPRSPQSPILNASGRATAQILRMRVIVRWNEAQRKRSLVMDTAKTQRP
ncbi:MAG TPA: prepilin-type N-terminal cleavage/methylation domain-containing protein [Thermoanaerobaculia bacterium]|nr:prepilin-type N-terminal cleavage/methylation domain-containing protein [Thermoanaerobaculia bacterium]